MMTNKPNRVQPNESRRRVFVHLVRHGEPVEYAARDSPLTAVGEAQGYAFGERLIRTIAKVGRPAVIRIEFSARPRTQGTTTQIQRAVQTFLEHGAHPQIKLLNIHSRKSLLPEGTFKPLIQQGIPRDKLYEVWTTTKEQALKAMGSKTPREHATELLRVLNRLNRLSSRLSPNGPDVHYVLVTHEVAQGALLKTVFGDAHPPKIGYAEPMKVTLGLGANKAEFEFRGRTAGLTFKKRT